MSWNYITIIKCYKTCSKVLVKFSQKCYKTYWKLKQKYWKISVEKREITKQSHETYAKILEKLCRKCYKTSRKLKNCYKKSLENCLITARPIAKNCRKTCSKILAKIVTKMLQNLRKYYQSYRDTSVKLTWKYTTITKRTQKFMQNCLEMLQNFAKTTYLRIVSIGVVVWMMTSQGGFDHSIISLRVKNVIKKSILQYYSYWLTDLLA